MKIAEEHALMLAKEQEAEQQQQQQQQHPSSKKEEEEEEALVKKKTMDLEMVDCAPKNETDWCMSENPITFNE